MSWTSVMTIPGVPTNRNRKIGTADTKSTWYFAETGAANTGNSRYFRKTGTANTGVARIIFSETGTADRGGYCGSCGL